MLFAPPGTVEDPLKGKTVWRRDGRSLRSISCIQDRRHRMRIDPAFPDSQERAGERSHHLMEEGVGADAYLEAVPTSSHGQALEFPDRGLASTGVPAERGEIVRTDQMGRGDPHRSKIRIAGVVPNEPRVEGIGNHPHVHPIAILPRARGEAGVESHGRLPNVQGRHLRPEATVDRLADPLAVDLTRGRERGNLSSSVDPRVGTTRDRQFDPMTRQVGKDRRELTLDRPDRASALCRPARNPVPS